MKTYYIRVGMKSSRTSSLEKKEVWTHRHRGRMAPRPRKGEGEMGAMRPASSHWELARGKRASSLVSLWEYGSLWPPEV